MTKLIFWALIQSSYTLVIDREKKLWRSSRFDAFSHYFAFRLIKRERWTRRKVDCGQTRKGSSTLRLQHRVARESTTCFRFYITCVFVRSYLSVATSIWHGVANFIVSDTFRQCRHDERKWRPEASSSDTTRLHEGAGGGDTATEECQGQLRETRSHAWRFEVRPTRDAASHLFNMWQLLTVVVFFRDEINKAFRRLSVLLHPDKSIAPGSEEAFKLLVQARTSLLKAARWSSFFFLSSRAPPLNSTPSVQYMLAFLLSTHPNTSHPQAPHSFISLL